MIHPAKGENKKVIEAEQSRNHRSKDEKKKKEDNYPHHGKSDVVLQSPFGFEVVEELGCLIPSDEVLKSIPERSKKKILFDS